MKILIAEDNPTSALFLRRTLSGRGHEVTVTADGVDAWEAMRAGPVPLLISDWVMPRMNGLELCKLVRGREGCDYTYVILLTSRDGRADRIEGLRAGADDFLTKPLDPDELAVRLEIAGRILAVHEALARQNAKLAELASVDELTGVKNRRRFREDLDMYFALWSRHKTPLSLIMLDVDNFKKFNDAFGHPAGDDVLRGLARQLREGSRDHDVVARYGGEEFVLLLPSTPAVDAISIAERLRVRIERMPSALRPITASLGVATTCDDLPACSALVEAADQALYRSKHAGRNRVTHSRQLAGSDAPALDGGATKQEEAPSFGDDLESKMVEARGL
jgi:two-component system cell cycle response regulator